MSGRYTHRCPNSVTSDCVTYVGDDIPCLNICNGDLLTEVQNAIATKLCELVRGVDMSSVTIPDCIKVAWGTQDETILNFIQFLLDAHCTQQTLLEGMATAITQADPIFTLTYNCCGNGCITGAQLTVSNHLQKIIDCLCDTISRVETLENNYATQAAALTALQAQYTTLSTNYASLLIQVTNLQTTVDGCCG